MLTRGNALHKLLRLSSGLRRAYATLLARFSQRPPDPLKPERVQKPRN